jgi:hypothetical protein
MRGHAVSASQAITITSKLAAKQRLMLEQLLFFNVNQHRVRGGIEESIATYGKPEIVEQDGFLRICVGDNADVQSLFAVSESGRPLGLAVYLRRETERFIVLHVGVECGTDGQVGTNTAVLLKLMHEIRGAARRTRGVAQIELVYKREHPVHLHV